MDALIVSACAYVLKLECGKYYVGITYNLNIRFAQHKMGMGALWTRKYKPISVEYVSFTDSECDLTLKYMKEYGWQNVRGAAWCKIDMTKAPLALRIERENEDDHIEIITTAVASYRDEKNGIYPKTFRQLTKYDGTLQGFTKKQFEQGCKIARRRHENRDCKVEHQTEMS